MLILTTGTHGPNLASVERVVSNASLTLKFRCRYKLLYTFRSDCVAEMRVAEFGGSDPLLLLLHPPARFHSQSNCPLEIFIRHLGIAGIKQLQKPAYGLIHGVRIPPA